MEDNNKQENNSMAMSFIRNYADDAQEELEAVVNKQLEEIKQKQEEKNSDLKSNMDNLMDNINQNRERVNDNFETLSKNRGDQNKFLILIHYNEKAIEENNSNARDWDIFNNRQDTYNFLKESIDDLDLEMTRVIAETLPFTNDLSAGSFMVYCLDSGKIEDNFDPRGEYLPEDYEIEV